MLPSEAAVIHDLPATSFIRTVADLGRRLPLMEGVGIVDTALHRRLVLVEHLQRWIEAHPHYKGIGRLRGVIGLADGRSESPMETRLRLLLILNGLPRPAVQVPLYDRAGLLLARTDLYYPRDRLAIEYDGATHRANLESDNRRQNRLLEAGYRLLRFSAGDILRAPASVVGQVQRALRYSSGSPN